MVKRAMDTGILTQYTAKIKKEEELGSHSALYTY